MFQQLITARWRVGSSVRLSVALLSAFAIISVCPFGADARASSITLMDQNTARCLDSNLQGNLYTLGCNGGPYQEWDVRPDAGTSGYTLIDHETGLCLDSNAAGNDYTHSCNGGLYQLWDVRSDVLIDTYTLVDHQTGLCLDSNAAGSSYTHSCNGGTFQNWGVLGGWPFCLANCSPSPSPHPSTSPSPSSSSTASPTSPPSPAGHPVPSGSLHILLRCSFRVRPHRLRPCSWTIRHRPLRNGQSIRLTGRFTPPVSGEMVVELEGLVPGTHRWRSFWVGPTSAAGKFAHTYTFTATTQLMVYSLRAVLLAGSGSQFRATASEPVRVRVTR